jgi:hypothetical protein
MRKDHRHPPRPAPALVPAPAPASPTRAPDAVEFEDDERAALRLLVKNLNDSKIGLADQEILILQAEQTRMQHAQRVMDQRKALTDTVAAIAKAHGLDLEDPSNGTWQLQFDTLSLKKIS